MKYPIGGDHPYRERVGVVNVRQEDGEYWIQITAVNAPHGTLPRICILPETSIIIEEAEEF